MREDPMPYTSMIRNTIIAEIEKMQIVYPSTSNGEFIAGSEHTKKEIIKNIKQIKL